MLKNIDFRIRKARASGRLDPMIDFLENSNTSDLRLASFDGERPAHCQNGLFEHKRRMAAAVCSAVASATDNGA